MIVPQWFAECRTWPHVRKDCHLLWRNSKDRHQHIQERGWMHLWRSLRASKPMRDQSRWVWWYACGPVGSGSLFPVRTLRACWVGRLWQWRTPLRLRLCRCWISGKVTRRKGKGRRWEWSWVLGVLTGLTLAGRSIGWRPCLLNLYYEYFNYLSNTLKQPLIHFLIGEKKKW